MLSKLKIEDILLPNTELKMFIVDPEDEEVKKIIGSALLSQEKMIKCKEIDDSLLYKRMTI